MNVIKQIKSLKLRKKPISKEKKFPRRKMIVLKKKQLASAILIMLVAIAGYLNYNLKYDVADPDAVTVYNEASKKLGEAQMVNAKESSYQKPESANGYFSEARMQRETKREETIDTLLELLNSDGADKHAKEVAQEQIGELAGYTEKEVTMENIIKAKGYEDAVVFMGENLISIAVFSAGLNEVDAAVISDIATSVTGYSADKVNIVEIGE
ncbi:MAG: SpoIIIAH-like family protein [Ruminococcaceae bacterium]|nr:SpoIIIAH-like family protein [Oscillospiraceae bacterium]